MVQDVRDIILSQEELDYAFKCYQRMAPEYFANEPITSVSVTEDSVIVAIDVGKDGTRKTQNYVFKGIEILKPLIRYCIENNIMLPRDGKKSVLIRGGKVILHVELDLTSDLPAVVHPMQLKDDEKDKLERAKNFIAVATAGV